MNEQFWMIWIEGKSGPTKQHFVLDEARLEAERLLRQPGNQGQRAFILKSTSVGDIQSPVSWRTVAERGER